MLKPLFNNNNTSIVHTVLLFIYVQPKRHWSMDVYFFPKTHAGPVQSAFVDA